MIQPDSTSVGDLVEVTEAFKDYGKVGDVYRILDARVPREATSALAWKVDVASGRVDLTQAFKIPHDKAEPLNRKKAAKMFSYVLQEAQTKMTSAEREYKRVKSRIDGLLNYETKKEEAEALLGKTFYWI